VQSLTEVILNPPVFDDEEQTRIASLVHTLLLGAMAAGFVYFFVAMVVYDSLLPILAAALVIPAWYGMLLLLHRGRLQQVRVLSVSVFWLAVTVMTVSYGGLHGSAVVTYLVVVVAAGLILGARAGSIFVALSLLSATAMLWAEARGLMPAALVEPTPLILWAGLTVNLILAALLVRLAASNISQALAQARNQEKALAESNRGLEAEIVERIRAEEALREREGWLRAIIEGTHAMLVQVDAAGRLVYANDAVARTLGRSASSLRGMSYLDLVHPEDREKVHRAFEQDVPADAHPPSLEFRLLSANGQPLWVRVAAHPIHKGDDVVGQMAVAVDISDRVATEEALRDFAQELQERNEELDAFAHTVAHGLQDPLSLVVGFADVLQGEYRDLPAEVMHRRLGIIAESGLKMSKIIDNLLLLARVRQREVEVRPLNMSAIVEEAWGRLAHLIEERDAEISVPESFPLVRGYGPWLEEVWVNYLANAIRYGGQPPRIQIGAHRVEQGMVRFWIRDNGRGISPEEQARLFVPFSRLGSGLVRGHGLGLSIVHRIIDKLGGDVGADSAGPGQGSTFYFTLPEA
jgi:PAS domain S-box-containing protein